MKEFKNNASGVSIDGLILVLLVAIMFASFRSFGLVGMSFIVTFLSSLFFVFLYLMISSSQKDFWGMKQIFEWMTLIAIVTTSVASLTGAYIGLRHLSNSEKGIFDSPLQVEDATTFFINGKNPYHETYHDTNTGRLWKGKIVDINDEEIDNPALFHFIYLPSIFILSAPLHIAIDTLFSWYDVRMLYLFVYFCVLFLVYKIPKSNIDKKLFFMLTAFNPLFVPDLIGGLNDVVLYFFLLLAMIFLQKGRVGWSSFFIALGATTKQTFWFLIPFYFVYLYLGSKKSNPLGRVKEIFIQTLPFTITFIAIMLPFFLWSPADFIQDVFLYGSGSLPTSYPIGGVGFAALLFVLGIVKDTSEYFPFSLVQAIIGIPLFLILLKRQINNNTISQVLFNYAIFLLIFFIFARFFSFSYFGYVIVLLVASYFIERGEIERKHG